MGRAFLRFIAILPVTEREAAMSVKKVIYDTDPRIDDAMALLLLHYAPAIDLVGIITVMGMAGAPPAHIHRHNGLGDVVLNGGRCRKRPASGVSVYH